MPPTTHLRINDAITVPIGTTFVRHLDGLYAMLPGRLDPYGPLGPETEARVEAFLSGSIVYPVNDNGVLDMERGWSDRVVADRSLTTPAAEVPFDYQGLRPIPEAQSVFSGPLNPDPKVVQGVPRINWDKVSKPR